LIILLTLSPLLSYFIVTMSPINSGIYFFNAIILIAFVIVISQFLVTGKINFPFYLKFLLAFSLYVIISDVFISNKEPTFFYFFKDQVLFGFFAAVIIENTNFHTSYIKKLTRLLKILFWLSVIVILFQQLVNFNFLLNPNVKEDFEATSEMDRRFASIYSYLGGPLLAGFSVIPMLGLIVAEKIKQGDKKVSVYYFAATIFSVISKSRWIIFNLLLTIFVRYNLKKFGLGSMVKIISSIVILAVVSFYTLTYLNFNIDELIQDRFLETSHGGLSKGAASSRLIAFDVFGDLYPDNPLFGKGNLKWGEGSTGDKQLEALLAGRSSQIHVGYLSLFYWYGLTGAVLFLFFLYNLIKKLRFNARRNEYWGAYWGMMGFVVANFTLVYLNINVIGLLLCLVYNKYYEDVANSSIARTRLVKIKRAAEATPVIA